MVLVDAQACWVANTLFSAASLLVAMSLWGIVFTPAYRRNYRPLLWLLPALLVCLWLESALAFRVGWNAPTVPVSTAALARHMGIDLIAFAALALAFVSLRRVVSPGKSKSPVFAGIIAPQAEGRLDTDLRHAAENFLAAVDKGDVATVDAIYAPEFACVRVADEGGFVQMPRAQMVAFLNRASTSAASQQNTAHLPTISTRETAIHHTEIIGETGIVLLTRVKDLGSGWEPLFYSLLWTKQEGRWRLLRELVHQRTVPRWR